MFEFFSSVDGELGDAKLVGLGGVSVMSFDVLEVSFEDESSVGFFSGFEGGSEVVLPLGEGINFG